MRPIPTLFESPNIDLDSAQNSQENEAFQPLQNLEQNLNMFSAQSSETMSSFGAPQLTSLEQPIQPQYELESDQPTLNPQHDALVSQLYSPAEQDSMADSVSEHSWADTATAAPRSSLLGSARRLGLYAALFMVPIATAVLLNRVSASSISDSELVSPTSSAALAAQTQADTQTYQQAVPVSANGDAQATPAQATSFEYELSLSAGFLRKAVQFSNSATQQTAEDKARIVGLLNQSIEAANRAIGINPNDPRGYTSRGRVYQASSTVKPEMKQLADQDFATAAQLGSTAPTQDLGTPNPQDFLPTQQAAGKSTAMVAEPNTATKQTVSAESTQGANKGTVTMSTATQEVFVPYAAVKDDTQLYIKPENNPDNATFYVKNKEAGKGFTVSSTQPASAPITITWWEIL